MKNKEKPSTSSASSPATNVVGTPILKNKEKLSSSSVLSPATNVVGKPILKKSAQDEHREADDSGHKTNRPGFDLGGASDDANAVTGLSIGNDASDTPGERRLPGRRPDNKLTIPRWSGPEPHGTDGSSQKPTDIETPTARRTKKEG